ncbi:hypothetical protein [Polaribacter sp. MED152]|uniref:hypothetical protein n=1 Tax=Polaribacter sp. MED152 TaxID=313598 RepID=UPI00006899A6|nr:hypothetical protein [Polaribacter sp. MED152]EAQ40777.1 hypothetical protein MED152_12104 [Polaribacter sp. MED152]
MRVFSFLILIICITSCDNLSLVKNTNEQVLDTIVDFTSVDTYPSFKVCDSLIDKIEKQSCFRATIHKKVGEELQQHIFTITDSLNEIVLVDLVIAKDGVINFKGIQTSKLLKKELPKFDSLVKSSVDKLDKVYPAIKRGIPVTTRYQLPIKIKLKN